MLEIKIGRERKANSTHVKGLVPKVFGSLTDWIADDTSGEFRDVLVALANSSREADSESAEVDVESVQHVCNERKLNISMNEFIEIFVHRSRAPDRSLTTFFSQCNSSSIEIVVRYT